MPHYEEMTFADYISRLPDCPMKQAATLSLEREQREDGIIHWNELKHLFDSDETLVSLAQVEAQLVQQIHDDAPGPGELITMAVIHGMVIGADAQRLYEQQTRDALDNLPTQGPNTA